MKKTWISSVAATAALTMTLSGMTAFAGMGSVSGNSVSGNSVTTTVATEETAKSTETYRHLTDEEIEEIRVNGIISEFVNKAASYLLGRPNSKVAQAQDNKVTVNTVNGKVTVSSDYSAVTDKDSVVTVTASKDDNAVKVLSDYVALVEPNAVKVVGPIKVQMFKAGKAVVNNFGTFTMTFNVGTTYNGRTAVAYQIHNDGSVSNVPAIVAGGKVTVALTDMGSIVIAIQ